MVKKLMIRFISRNTTCTSIFHISLTEVRVALVTQKYLDLMARPLDEAARAIRPLVSSKSEGHPDYGDEIADFRYVLATHRRGFMPAAGMFANLAHNGGIYDDLVDLVGGYKATNVLDVGCGGSDFLSELDRIGLGPEVCYGCSIHIGECIVAHECGYTNVAPLDMRELIEYYSPNSFDCIVISAALQYLVEEDRKLTMRQAMIILTPGGHLICRDYYGHSETRIPPMPEYQTVLEKSTEFGNIVVFEKSQ
jgi:SAM-dependent methyltransferase